MINDNIHILLPPHTHSQGKFVIIKDFVLVDPGTVLAPNTVCPALTRWAGNPGRMVDVLPESTPEVVEARVRQEYKRYKAVRPSSSSSSTTTAAAARHKSTSSSRDKNA